ncbi:MAG TPA: EamA family transporter [Geobacteraceae bacterium]
MSSLAFALILFSGIMHSLYNFLIKKSQDKTIFIWWLFLTSLGIFAAMLPFLPGPFPRPDAEVMLLTVGGAFCFVLYHLFTGRAYQHGDLSVTYPLSQTGMLYLPLWGVWLLGEHLSLTGFCGIITIMAGAYLLQLRRLTLAELLRPFGSLIDTSVHAALAAGFVYSLGAIIDKIGVTCYHPVYFTFLMVLVMLAFMTVNMMRPRYRTRIMAEWHLNRRFIVAGAPLMMGSFLSFRYGLALSPMSYAVPVRQVSVLIGVVAGVLFLGESCGKIRLLGSLLIIAGIFLVRVG